MPYYSIEDLNTSEISEVSMSYADFQEFLKQSPHIKQVFTKFPGICDPVRIGVRKHDDSFNDVISKAKQAHKHNTIGNFT